MMHLCVCSGGRGLVPGRGQPPGDQNDAKGVWFEFPFEVLECLLRRSFQANWGRPEDHLTVT
jgi:hypothetical protein